jgi:hypothetical protein
VKQRDTDAKRKTPIGLAGHPQLAKITEAIIEGQSARQISAWTRPPVSFATISRYARHTVLPALEKKKSQSLVVAPNMMENAPKTAIPAADTDVTHDTTQAITSAPILAIRDKRLQAIQDRHDRMMMIVEERAEDMADVPGGRSGLLTRDFKGEGGDRVEVYKFDAKLASELREHEKHIAIELGQWNENAPANVAIQIVLPQGASPAKSAEDFPIIDIGLPNRPKR